MIKVELMNSLNQIVRRPLDYLDGFLDSFTSYRLVLYFLMILVGWATLLGFTGNIADHGQNIAFSTLALVATCLSVNWGVSRFLNIYANRESYLITALILALILPPASTLHGYAVLVAAGVAAMASKYILTYGRRHIFNPAALGAYFVGTVMHTYPSWWVGTKPLAPLVFVGGVLIMRKVQRFTMVTVFMLIYLAFLIINGHGGSSSHIHDLWLGVIGTPVMFFAYIMLTEPLTSPRTLNKYLPYAGVVGILYSVTKLRISPEEALLIGNILAFALAPTRRLKMQFSGQKAEADGILSFGFRSKHKLNYQPGQYLEWTLPGSGSDSRGNRRYLTLSSSPTENFYSVAIKMPPENPSSFKQTLAKLGAKDYILAGSLAGSFTLPKNAQQKLSFIAGGIGVTPYRSMIKYLVDTNQNRDICLFYSANQANQLAYKSLFKNAQKCGLKTIYVATKDAQPTPGVHSGTIDKDLIIASLPDWKDRLFYISGPVSFVKYIRIALLDIGVKPSKIKADYFPGYG